MAAPLFQPGRLDITCLTPRLPSPRLLGGRGALKLCPFRRHFDNDRLFSLGQHPGHMRYITFVALFVSRRTGYDARIEAPPGGSCSCVSVSSVQFPV